MQRVLSEAAILNTVSHGLDALQPPSHLPRTDIFRFSLSRSTGCHSSDKPLLMYSARRDLGHRQGLEFSLEPFLPVLLVMVD
jgi:hypothetical protein